MKKITVLLLLLLASVAVLVYQCSEKSTDSSSKTNEWRLSHQEKTSRYTVDIFVEGTPWGKINKQIEDDNNDWLAQVKNIEEGDEFVPIHPFTLERTSQHYISSDRLGIETIVVSTYLDTRGAHPNFFYDTYMYANDSPIRYSIHNILDWDEDTIKLVRDAIIAEVVSRGAYADEQWIDDTLSQPQELVNDIYIQGDTLTLLFEPYSVGPYALGEVRVNLTIPEVLEHTRGWVQNAYASQ